MLMIDIKHLNELKEECCCSYWLRGEIYRCSCPNRDLAGAMEGRIGASLVVSTCL